jgi:hypothetical protein
MSKYTTEIRFVCETLAGLSESEGGNSVKSIIETASPKFFNFDYPIFDEAYRNTLQTKILKHYYTREIGYETVGLFKLKLDTKLNEIMPFYNQLYKSALLEFNPFYDVDLTREHKKKSEGSQDVKGNLTSTDKITTSDKTSHSLMHESDSTSTSDGSNHQTNVRSGENTKVQRNLFSETPQGALTGVETETYLTDARKITDTTNINETDTLDATTGDTTTQEINSNDSGRVDRDLITNNDTNATNTSLTNINNLEDYIETVKGKQGSGSYSSLLKEFRETFINVDMMVINELNDLFFGLW